MGPKESIIRYCSYQERSHKEVRKKLYELGCSYEEAEVLLSEMIEMDLVNEERYTKAVVRGKFHVKQWGRNKIIYKLKTQDVSEYCLNKALGEINEKEYLENLNRLTEKKWNELKGEKNIFTKKGKVFNYLRQKGYESELIITAINELKNKQ